jgi:DNA-binding beta-propeller fold protein YncE
MREPNGVAVDTAGNVYVTDAFNHKLMKFNGEGAFVKEWKGPDPGLYGPRDIAFGPNKQLYIVDQGRTRIVKFDTATEKFTEWGTRGEGPSQFIESTGIGVGGGFVFVADNGNNRIQVFDLNGKFVKQWEVMPWQRYVWNYPDIAIDESSKRLFVTNSWKNELFVFDFDGNMAATGFNVDAGKVDNPTAIVVSEANKKRQLMVLNTGGSRLSSFPLEAKPSK